MVAARQVPVPLLALYLLAVPAVVLAGAAVALVMPSAVGSTLNDGPHDLTEVLYAYTPVANGNGSAFAGLSANTDWYNTTLGIAMLTGRYFLLIPILALAGSFARARVHAPSLGTLSTSGPTFGSILVAVVLIFGGLPYLPAVMLGPLAEHLAL